MNQNVWSEVDRYLADELIGSDCVLDAILVRNAAAGLPAIDVSQTQGKLLYLLAKLRGARRILEVGTLGGYSTVWLARALPADGTVVTLELDPKHAAVARENFAAAGLAELIELRVGPAVDSLRQMEAEQAEPFDFVFLDADKPSNPAYLAAALRMSRAGTVIVGDNVVRDGAVADASDPDPRVKGSRELIARMGSDPRLDATAIQTVGNKGYDGFAIAVVRSSG